MTARPAAAILVGGRSRRMGRNKAHLPVEGRTLLERVAERVAPGASRILVVGGDEAVDPAWTWLPDAAPGQGPLGGIVAALENCGTEWCYVLACDCPCLEPALLELLAARAGPDCEAVVPRHRRGSEPLLALYRSSAAGAARALLQAGIRAAHRLPEMLATCWIEEPDLLRVDPTLRSLTNLNTRAELQAYARTLRGAPLTSPP